MLPGKGKAQVNINKHCLGHCSTVTDHLWSASYWPLSSTLDMSRVGQGSARGHYRVTIALITHESPRGCASQGWELVTAEHVVVSPEVTELPVTTVHRMPFCHPGCPLSAGHTPSGKTLKLHSLSCRAACVLLLQPLPAQGFVSVIKDGFPLSK